MAHKPVPIARQKSWSLGVQITISISSDRICAWLSMHRTTVCVDKFYLRFLTKTKLSAAKFEFKSLERSEPSYGPQTSVNSQIKIMVFRRPNNDLDFLR
jgi:hypothetical protein